MSEPTIPTAQCAWCAAETTRVFRPGTPEQRRRVTVPEDAVAIVQPMLVGADREHCVQLALDTKHRLIAATTVSIGSCEHTFIGPREVFRDALLHGASAVVVAHNHPSADATPSADDRHITRRLAQEWGCGSSRTCQTRSEREGVQSGCLTIIVVVAISQANHSTYGT